MAKGWRRDFRYVWAGETASLVGTQVFQLAMPLTAVLTLDATPGQLGVLGALTFAPYLVLGLPAGLLVDRWQRRGVLIISSLGQAVTIGAIPLLAALDRLTFSWLLVMACLSGTARVFFNIAYRSYLPAIVPPEHLTGANSRLTASESVAEIGGPGLGGLLVNAFGAPLALLADAVSYLGSAIGIGAVRRREKPVEVDKAPLRSQISEGFRFTFANPYLRAFLGEAASYNICWQIVQTVLVLFAVRELGMSAGVLGFMLSIGAVGALLGASVTGRVANRAGLGRTLLVAAVIGDLAPLLLPTAQRGVWAAPLFAIAFFIQGFGITACNVHSMTLRQAITPEQLLGRTNAAYLFVALGVKPLGSLLGGWLGTVSGPRTALLIGTLGLLSTSLFLVLSPLRRVRTLGDILDEKDEKDGRDGRDGKDGKDEKRASASAP